MESMSHGSGMKTTTQEHGNATWRMPKKSRKMKIKVQMKKQRSKR